MLLQASCELARSMTFSIHILDFGIFLLIQSSSRSVYTASSRPSYRAGPPYPEFQHFRISKGTASRQFNHPFSELSSPFDALEYFAVAWPGLFGCPYSGVDSVCW